MGLDMYAFKVKKEDFNFDRKDDKQEELMYWRKHHDLHGWMEQLYVNKGGTEMFNGIPVVLSLDDLDLLERDIKNWNLPHTTGFFFGNNPPDEDSNEEDLAFIKKAREAINDGFEVIYNSSW